MGDFARTVGAVLRRLRRERDLTLHEVRDRSGGRFKPSVLGSYERGERSISLERFCELARVYRITPDRMLGEVMSEVSPESRSEVVIALDRLPFIEGEERRVVTDFIQLILRRRGDRTADVLTLRSGDLEVLAMRAGVEPPELLAQISPALLGRIS